jgi:PAS domain S-box-containing protein
MGGQVMTGKQIQVLLLEDEAAHAEAIRRAVESSDNVFKVQIVGSLKEFRDYIGVNPPDIALLDMVLPDGNGIDLLKSLPQPNAFPMLVLTSHGNENAAVEALKAGALDYVVKSPETFAETPRILTRNLNQWALIQENKKAAQLLQASEANFRNSMENSPLGIRIVSEDGETLYTNRAFLDIYGYQSLAEFNATPVKDRYTPNSYTEFRERRDKRRRKETLPDNYEISITRKNGDIRHLQVMRKEILWAGKLQYQTIYQDVTEQKKMDEALRLSEQNFRNSIDSSPMGIYITTPAWVPIYANQAFLDIFGYKNLDEIRAKHPHEFYTPESHAQLLKRREAITQGAKTPPELEVSIRRKDGGVRHIHVVRKAVIWNGTQQYQLFYDDVTEAKNAEAALRTSEEKYRLVLEKSSDVFYTFDPQGNFTYISLSVKNMLGYDPSDLIGRPFSSLLHPDDVQHLQQVVQRNIKDGTQTPGGNEYRVRSASGKWRWLNSSGNAVFDAHGRYFNFVGIARDITERKLISLKLDDLHKTMQLVTEINQLIVQIDNEKELLWQACNEFIRSRQYPLAWIGFKQAGSYSILPVVQCGEKADYLAAINITWDNSPLGNGPTGIATKTGKPDVIQDMVHDPRYEPWKEVALKYGFKAAAAFPLIIQDNVIGVLNIYSASVEAFNKDEVNLLEELAGDLSLGIEKIRRREEQLKLEAALKLSEQNFRNSLDSSIMGIRIVDSAWHTLYANHVFLDMFGYQTVGEIVRNSLQDHYTPEEKARYRERMERRARGESIPDNPKVDIIDKNGVVRSIVVYSNDVLWNGDKQRQLVYYDGTESQRAEAALKLSEQNFRNSLDSSLIGIRIVDDSGHNLYLNQTFLDFFGYDNAAEVEASPPQQHYTPDCYAEYLRRGERIAHGEPLPDEYEIDIIRKDGAVRHLQLFRRQVLWNGQPEFQILYNDLTERVQAEEARKLSEQNFRNSMDNSTMGIRIMGDADQTLYANQALLDMFGYANIDELNSSPPQQHYTPESQATFLERRAKFARGEPLPDRLEFDIIRKDGAVRHLQLSSTQIIWNGRQQYQILYNDITERVQAEQTLKASEEKYSTLIEQSSDGILIVDERKIVFANRKINEMMGFTQVEILGKYFYDLTAPEYRSELEEINRKRNTGQELSATHQLELLTKGGAKIAVETKLQPIIYKDKPAGMVIVHDITERVQAEAALKSSEQNFRNSMDKSSIGIHISDKQDNNLYANQAMLDIFGYKDLDEIQANPPQKYYTPDCYAAFIIRHEKFLRGEPMPKQIEADIVRKDGAVRNLQISMTDVFWNGKLQYQTLYNDITERKQAETALKLSEQNFRNSLDHSLIGIRIIDSGWHTLYANHAFLAMFGYENTAEADALGPDKLYTPQEYQRFTEREAQRRRGELVPDTLEIDTIRKDGAVRRIQTTRREILWNGQPQHQIFYNDITERVQAEAALKVSEENFRNTLDSSLMGIFIGHSGNVLYVNQAFLEMFGYQNIDEVKATRPVEFYSPESYARYLTHKERQKRGDLDPDNFEIDIVRKDGSKRHLQAYRKKVLWDGKLRSQILYNDVTALKQAEEERQKLEDQAQVASRLAVVGEMAAGVAHEINNPLTGVLGFSQMLLEKPNIPDDIKAELKLIVDGSQRVADIVKRLLTFARQTKPVKTVTDINSLIDNTLKLREYVFKTANINLVTRFDPELPWSVVDAGQLQQVFLNLIVNAEQAMKTAHGRGTLTVTTETKGKDIILSFQDDGPGIKPENLKRLFEPFFTTKAPGEGTGLGLSLSRSIILEHDGRMSVKSEFGHGANFIIELPVVESLPSGTDAPENTAKSPTVAAQPGSILVVDDEPGVRILLERVFIQMGHKVDTVADAESALTKLDNGSVYDVILTDVRMPGISGIELYAHILEKMPAMEDKIIFITGDVMGADIKDFLMQNNLSYFAKPFDIEALKMKICAMMTTSSGENSA